MCLWESSEAEEVSSGSVREMAPPFCSLNVVVVLSSAAVEAGPAAHTTENASKPGQQRNYGLCIRGTLSAWGANG